MGPALLNADQRQSMIREVALERSRRGQLQPPPLEALLVPRLNDGFPCGKSLSRFQVLYPLTRHYSLNEFTPEHPIRVSEPPLTI
jgi:hypothetical protein